MDPPNISVHLLTCAGRAAYLEATLASRRASDWGRVVEPEVLVNEDGEYPAEGVQWICEDPARGAGGDAVF